MAAPVISPYFVINGWGVFRVGVSLGAGKTLLENRVVTGVRGGPVVRGRAFWGTSLLGLSQGWLPAWLAGLVREGWLAGCRAGWMAVWLGAG